MQIDWVLILAQMVNFAALVWLLNRFLFQPARRAMAERRAKLRAEFDRAGAMAAEAAETKARFEAREAELAAAGATRLEEARQAAAAERKRLEREAREAVAALEKTWRAELERERQAFREALRHEAATAYVELARRALAELAGAELDERLAERLAQEIAQGGPELARRLSDAESLTVRSGAKLGAEARARLAAAVAELAGRDRPLRFTAEGAEPGEIRLSAPGVSVAWGVGPWLDAVTARVDARFDSALAAFTRDAGARGVSERGASEPVAG